MRAWYLPNKKLIKAFIYLFIIFLSLECFCLFGLLIIDEPNPITEVINMSLFTPSFQSGSIGNISNIFPRKTFLQIYAYSPGS